MHTLIIAHLAGENCFGDGSSQSIGIETPWKKGSFTGINITFVNFDNENCVAVDPCYKAYKNDCSNVGKFSETKFVNSPNKIIFKYSNEYLLEDTDGTFAEKNFPGKILPFSEVFPTDRCNNITVSQKAAVRHRHIQDFFFQNSYNYSFLVQLSSTPD